MKQKALKIGTALLLSICMLTMLLYGVISIFKSARTAIAAEGTVTATISVEEGNEILAGEEFTLSLTVNTTLDSSYFWSAAELFFTIFDEDNKDSYEYNASEYLEVSAIGEPFPDDSPFYGMQLYSGFSLDDVEHPSILFSFADISETNVSIQTACTLRIKVKVKDTTPGGTKIKFAIDKENASFSSIAYYYYPSEGTIETGNIYADDVAFSSNDVTITVREKSNDNTLSSLAVGTKAENVHTYTSTSTPPLADTMSYDYAEAAVLSSVNITPTANNEYATIYLAAGSTAPEQTEANLVESGKEKSIALTSGIRTVTILVKAETGDTKTYTVTIVDKYVALSDLKIEVGTKTDGVTKIGLGEDVTFNPETLSYTVDVPSDYASSEMGVKITPTIAEGHGIQTTVALAGTNSTPANSSVASGSAVQVTGIANDGTLVVTATASDGSTTKAYTITFKLWSVETGTLTVQVQGAEKQYESDEAKAAEKKIDYYFLLSDETECKGKFIITSSITNIPIQIQSSDGTAENYDATKDYGAGTYTIILTADAGNMAKFIAVITQQEYLELAAGSTYQFIFEETTGEGTRARSYLRTYHEKNMMHGVDDKSFEKVVLGNISPRTSINAFLANISASQHSMIRIYNNKDQLIYNCGADIEGIDKANYDKWNKYRISTSWYVEFGGEAGNPLETVFISVLGDVNKDGSIAASDISTISYHISGKRLLTDLEVRLAAYVTNSGRILSKDITQLGRVITSKAKIEDFHYKIESTEPAEPTTGA